jgi:phage tail-like protein
LNKDSKRVTDWIASLKLEVKRQTAAISALDTEGNPITTWNLEGVYPVKWNGPSMDVGNNQAATETLELAHNGFLIG